MTRVTAGDMAGLIQSCHMILAAPRCISYTTSRTRALIMLTDVISFCALLAIYMVNLYPGTVRSATVLISTTTIVSLN